MSRGLRERRQLSTRLQSQRDVFLAGSDLAQDASSPDPQGQDGSPCGTGAVQMDAGQAGRAVTVVVTGSRPMIQALTNDRSRLRCTALLYDLFIEDAKLVREKIHFTSVRVRSSLKELLLWNWDGRGWLEVSRI